LKGLIIDEPWIGLILSGEKIWEMRKTACHHRGPIALIRKGSGKVVGVAELIDSLPSIDDENDYARAEPLHRIPSSRRKQAFADGWRTPWVLDNAEPLAEPIPYNHPSGAVIWVNLDDSVARAIVTRSGHSSAKQTASGDGATKHQREPLATIYLVQSEKDFGEADPVRGPILASGMNSVLQFVVQRGRAAGTILTPHVHADGCYVVSASRFEKDYIRVRSIDEVKVHLRRGYSLRMSNSETSNHRAPSLIASASISGWR
jgi:hypothetical protein